MTDQGLRPHSLDAEQSALGAMLLSETAIEAVLEIGLAAEHFALPAHGHVFHAIASLYDSGKPADSVTVAGELSDAGLLDEVGGKAVLLDFVAATPAISNAATYAARITDHWTQWQYTVIGHELTTVGQNGTNPAEIIERLELLTSGAAGAPSLSLIPASSIAPSRAHWMWEQRLPVGGVSLMPGPEGAGKTMLFAWIAARLSRGQLAGEHHGRPADVVYVGVEDDRETVLVPRLIAAGADLDRIHFVDLPGGRSFALSGDIVGLRSQIRHLDDLALIAIDPLDSHLGGGVDSHKKSDVQAAIGRLATLAQGQRCAALGLAHLNKSSVNDYLTKVIGSKGFTTAVRSVLAVGENPADSAELVCLVAKANMTSRATVPAIRFRIEGCSIDHPTEPEPIDTAAVVITGETMDVSADSLIAPRDTDDEKSRLEGAMEWLKSVLSNGLMAKADLAELAEVRDISPATLKRAAAALKVDFIRDESARGRPSTWRLPGYGSSITAQRAQGDMNHNQEGPDQGKQSETLNYGSDSGVSRNQSFDGLGHLEGWRPCSRCGGKATDISGLCADCLAPANDGNES